MGVTPDQLLIHDAFVRGVARGILGEDAEVDDVVQETWIRALDAPPRKVGSLRSWLGVVSRSLSLKTIRSRQRRRNREVGSAPDEKIPSTDHIVACEEIRSRLVRAMVGLPEDYRSVLVLRYYDGLPPREVARRLDLPVETVKTRLKRGVARLRTTLEQEHPGDRNQWLGALVILADPRRQGPADGLAKLARVVGLVAGSLLVVSALIPDSPKTAVAPVARTVARVDLVPCEVPPHLPAPIRTREIAGLSTQYRFLAATEVAALTHDGQARLLAPAVTVDAGRTRARQLKRPAVGSLEPQEEAGDRDRHGPVELVVAADAAIDDDAPLGEVTLVVGGDIPGAEHLNLELPGMRGRRVPDPEDLPDGRVGVRLRLPLGTYEVGSKDPEISIEPTRFKVEPGLPSTVELRISRQNAHFTFRPDDLSRPIGDLEDGQVTLVPIDGSDDRATGTVRDFGEAVVRGLPPGLYQVFFTWPESEPEDLILLGAVDLPAGSSGHLFTVPDAR